MLTCSRTEAPCSTKCGWKAPAPVRPPFAGVAPLRGLGQPRAKSSALLSRSRVPHWERWSARARPGEGALSAADPPIRGSRWLAAEPPSPYPRKSTMLAEVGWEPDSFT